MDRHVRGVSCMRPHGHGNRALDLDSGVIILGIGIAGPGLHLHVGTAGTGLHFGLAGIGPHLGLARIGPHIGIVGAGSPAHYPTQVALAQRIPLLSGDRDKLKTGCVFSMGLWNNLVDDGYY